MNEEKTHFPQSRTDPADDSVDALHIHNVRFIMSGAEEDTSRAQSGAVCEVICQTFVEDYDQMSQDEQIALQERISFPVRKGAHLTEYAVLGALLALTAASFEIRGLYRGRGYALLTGLLYAVSDEIHQIFVPGRAGQLRDVIIDTCGIIIGICLIDGLSRFMKNYKHH